MFPLKKLARKGYHLSFTYSSGVVVPLIKYKCDSMHLIGSYYKRLKKHPKWSEVLVTLSYELSFLSITVTRVSCQRVLLRRGHVGQFYYIVYSGSVFVNVQDTRADGQVFHKTQAILTKGDAFGVRLIHTAWWRHQMETFSAILALCAGNSPVTGEFPTQRPVTRSFDVFFDLRLE